MKYSEKYPNKELQLRSVRLFLIISLLFTAAACEKFVSVDHVKDNLIASTVFQSEATANSAITGIYRTLLECVGQAVANITILSGTSADELYIRRIDENYGRYYENTLLSSTGTDWSRYYNIIYHSNTAIEGLAASSTITESKKDQFTAEARFVRAYCYFNLINLFGDVPLITSTDVRQSSTAFRANMLDVYQLVVDDLEYAVVHLPTDYSHAGGARNRVNAMAARAMLARVHLYQRNFNEAIALSAGVLTSSQFGLIDINSSLFSANNSEAIFQLANNPTEWNWEPRSFLVGSPSWVVTDSFMASIEENDQRRERWLSPYHDEAGNILFRPYKFTDPNAGSNERFTLLRLAEQYLIRAEAKIQSGDIAGGIADLNVIRRRAGLPELESSMDQGSALLAVAQERRIELFCEFGHRWLDLKRTDRVDAVLAEEKPDTWKSTAALYPIPLTDIQRNPNLTQNPGYE